MFSLSPRVSELLKDKKEEKEVKYLPKKEKAIIKYHGWMKKRKKKKKLSEEGKYFHLTASLSYKLHLDF